MRIDLGQLAFVDANLREIATELEARTGVEFTVTSLFRIGDPGVHGQLPLRGVDLRMRDAETGTTIANDINRRWVYDPKRPELACAVLHGDGPNLHLHLQTHPNTARI